MPVGFQTDNYDRRVLLVSDKNDGITYEPIHKEDGRPFLPEAPLIPAGFVGADGNWHAGHVDADGNLLTASGGGGSGGTSAIDQAAFAQGVTLFTPNGGVFNEGLTDLTSGQMGVQRITTERAGHVNLRSDDGTEIGTAANPVFVSPFGSDIVNNLVYIRQKAGWNADHVPAVNVRATATKAAGGVGIKHVCTGFTVTLASGGTPSAIAILTVALIDGVSGGVVFLWRSRISLTTVAGQMNPISRSGLWLEGSFNTAMTLEFSAAGGTNVYESITLEGVSTQ